MERERGKAIFGEMNASILLTYSNFHKDTNSNAALYLPQFLVGCNALHHSTFGTG